MNIFIYPPQASKAPFAPFIKAQPFNFTNY